MPRTEREKQDELLGMIRRDFTPRNCLLDGSDCGSTLCPESEETDDAIEGHRCTSDCRRIGCEEVEARQSRAEALADSDFTDYGLQEMDAVIERDDDEESWEGRHGR
jgi:hypothetical protein